MLLLSVSAALLAVACGGEVTDSVPASDTAPQTTESEPAAAEPEPEPDTTESEPGSTDGSMIGGRAGACGAVPSARELAAEKAKKGAPRHLGANGGSGANHESEERVTGVEAYGMVGLVCEVMRNALRAVYDAGDNPTRADIYAKLASLGPVDSLDMIPASIRSGKTATPDAIHYLVFEYPCEQPAPFGVENICIYPITDYRPPPS